MYRRIVRCLFLAALPVLLLPFAHAGAEQTHPGYLRGFADGTLRPEEPLTRAQLVCALSRLADGALFAERVSFADLPVSHWAYPAAAQLCGAGVLPFGADGWFRPAQSVSWYELSAVFDALAASEAGREAFGALTRGWNEKTVLPAEADALARDTPLSRAEFARVVNALLGRVPDANDAQLRAASWFSDNRDTDAWYYAALIEASVSHTCRFSNGKEVWSAIG